MNKWIIFTIIVIIIFLIIILEIIIYAKKIIKKGKKEKVKIIKIEEKINRSADHDDPEIMRHWYNLEIELNGKILKRQVAITNYTKKLKVNDCINIVVYKNNFLLEDEIKDYGNNKKIKDKGKGK